MQLAAHRHFARIFCATHARESEKERERDVVRSVSPITTCRQFSGECPNSASTLHDLHTAEAITHFLILLRKLYRLHLACDYFLPPRLDDDEDLSDLFTLALFAGGGVAGAAPRFCGRPTLFFVALALAPALEPPRPVFFLPAPLLALGSSSSSSGAGADRFRFVSGDPLFFGGDDLPWFSRF
uniref:Uncharacterized protein n=1 Tax=Triticum urartu TaxID=4572 RepID=A0A8R7UH20_TRIUA